ADLRQPLLVCTENVADAGEPGAILRPPEIEPVESEEQARETEEQDDSDPGVDRARPLAAAEQNRQEEQRGIEHREARQRQQHEADRCDPMVRAGARGVAVDDDRMAGMKGVAAIDVGSAHGLPPRESRSAAVSSSSATRLAPVNRWCTAPAATATPIRASPANWVTPFH